MTDLNTERAGYTDDLRELRVMTTLLTAAYRTAADDIRSGLHGWPEGTDPMTAQDTNGRYVLVDALGVLVAARTALVQSHG